MRIAIIGATGHVGGYLVPRLVRAGHDVVAISRGTAAPYHADDAWDSVERIAIDREREDAAGTFGARIADLGADVVIDMICFTPESATQLVEALRGRVGRLVMCSTIWVKGTLCELPAAEDVQSPPWGDYGTGKAAIEAVLSAESVREDGLENVTLRPGHISGPGWRIVGPVGNIDLAPWEALADGRELVIPNFGLETVHHVHADDVAQAFQLAAEAASVTSGSAYNVVSEHAVSLRGFAEAAAAWFGRDANLRFAPFAEFSAQTSAEFAAASLEHVSRSHSMSIEKARRELGYSPRYSSLEAVREAVEWLYSSGQLVLAGRLAG
jgi:nucleoside-diphosphate-sugar epimerase